MEVDMTFWDFANVHPYLVTAVVVIFMTIVENIVISRRKP
jgi:hypothetical protein